MKQITATFLKGLFTLLPLLLSIYVLLWFLTLVEGASRAFILTFLPDFLYIPGMGVVLVCLLIYGFGTIIDRPLAKWMFGLVDRAFSGLPIIKTVYMAIKDFTEYLKPSKDKKANQVVLVRMPDSKVEIVGLMTRESLNGLPEAITKEGQVAVYFPMSYQIGGYTLFIPATWVHATNLPVESAMRSIITAWLPPRDKVGGPV